MHKGIILSFLLALASISQAQISIGITGGMNMANWPGEDEVIINNASRLNLDELLPNATAEVLNVDNKSRFAPTVGLVALYELNDQWAIESGVYYSPQGDRIEGDAILTVVTSENIRYVAKSQTDYINVPLKAKYNLENNVSFNLGPQIGYRLNGLAITEGKADNLENTLEFEQNVEDRLKNIDYGLIGGVAYQFENGFGANLEHYLGASQIPKEDRKVHNSVTSFKIFYLFN